VFFSLLLAALVIVLLTSNTLADSDIHGTVTDAETEDPIEDADVYIYDPDDKNGNSYETLTDGEGYYEVTVDPGHYEIKIFKDGYETHTGEEDVGFEEQVEHNAELVPEEETYLEGYVTDANTNDPIEGAKVALTADDKKDDKKSPSVTRDDKEDKEEDKKDLSATTNSEGYYNISCGEGEYSIEITHEDYETHENSVTVEAGGNSYNAELTSSGGGVGDDGNGGGDDDGFEIVGSGGIMVSGWIVAVVLISVIVIQMKNRVEESEEENE